MQQQSDIVVHRHAHGEVRYRRHASGTCYHEETPKAVVDWLETARERGDRVRLYYGDPATGKDWLEEHDVRGTIGRSTGQIKIPLVIPTARSTGGPGILDHCVVKLEVAGREVWRHSSYHLGKIEAKPSEIESHPYGVFRDGDNVANFRTPAQRDRYLKFIGAKPEREAPRGISL